MNNRRTDEALVGRFWSRDESVLEDTASLYGAYLFKVAFNILAGAEDCEECVNDTWLAAWNRMPPHRPDNLLAFLSKITRGYAVDRWRKKTSSKRGGGRADMPFDELDEIVASRDNTETRIDGNTLAAAISRFLEEERPVVRQAFLCRYFFCDSSSDIARLLGRSEGGIKCMLFRTREKLRKELIREGWFNEKGTSS